MDETLRQTAALLQGVADASESLIYATDLEGRFIFANRKLEALLGVAPGGLTGKAREAYLPAEVCDEHRKNDLVVLDTAEPLTAEETNQEADGPHTYLSVKSPLRDADGRVFGIAGISTDITGDRRLQSKAYATQARLDAAVESMTDAVFISDVEGRFIEFNEAFATFHRFGSKEECAKTLAEYPDFLDVYLPSGELAPLEQRAVPRALRGETRTNEEYDLRRKDTGERWTGSYSFAPIRSEDGEIVGSVVVGRDVTEQKRKSEQLEHISRLYATLSEVNQTIVRVKQPEKLYSAMCDIAVGFGGFELAWVGLYDESIGRIEPVAASGVDLEHWPFGDVSLTEGPFKDGMAATAIRSGEVVVSSDMEFDDRMRESAANAKGWNFHASAAVPFRLKGRTVGVLVLASRNTGLFTAAAELPLLDEMGLDISFALDSMAIEGERERAVGALSESEEKYRALFETMSDGVVYENADGTITSANPAAQRLLGLSLDQMQGRTSLDPRWKAIHADGSPWPGETHPIPAALKTGKPVADAVQGVFNPQLGDYVWLSVNAVPEFLPGDARPFRAYAVFRDITERMRAEAEVAAHTERLKVLADTSEALVTSGSGVQAQLDQVAAGIAEAFGSSCHVRLPSIDGTWLDVVALSDEDPDELEAVRQLVTPDPIGADAPDTVSHVFRTGQASLVPVVPPEKLSAVVSPHAWPAVERLAPHSVIIAPLRTQLGVTGVLVLTRYKTGQPSFTEADLGLAQELADRAAMAIANAKLLDERARNLERIAGSLSSMITVVSRVVEARDPYTAGHERRVSELAVRIAAEMGMSAQQTEDIRTAALVHDVGKVSVPAEILSKPGKLTPLEFSLIQGHAESGYEILASANMEHEIAEMVQQHHERCDGSGYPRGLSEDELLEGAKVLAVADVVEAMVSHRPYRAGLGVDAALAEIERGSGLQYDSGVSEACLRVFHEGAFEFTAV
jgi:PAS domain S-box-containing protein/putative nucleotidyltransferase with HDIG domain